MSLTGFQKRSLRALAHGIKPVAFVGQKGATPALVQAVEAALEAHELIKVKFVDLKDKAEKAGITDALARRTGAEVVGTIGHVLMLYRPHPNAKKRRIRLPQKTAPAAG